MQPAEKNSKGKSSVLTVFLTPEKAYFSSGAYLNTLSCKKSFA
jgi:hypothetical protein